MIQGIFSNCQAGAMLEKCEMRNEFVMIDVSHLIREMTNLGSYVCLIHLDYT